MRTIALRLACALVALSAPMGAAAQDETAAEESRDEARGGRAERAAGLLRVEVE